MTFLVLDTLPCLAEVLLERDGPGNHASIQLIAISDPFSILLGYPGSFPYLPT